MEQTGVGFARGLWSVTIVTASCPREYRCAPLRIWTARHSALALTRRSSRLVDQREPETHAIGTCWSRISPSGEQRRDRDEDVLEFVPDPSQLESAKTELELSMLLLEHGYLRREMANYWVCSVQGPFHVHNPPHAITQSIGMPSERVSWCHISLGSTGT
ncbi:hypothetical protein PLICRDRAFT_39942 [Plicaturopsis crispa FD-325 SS-3]|nr:hypothetical protein PLICRDRAFT_39942 [Plicaturopsis crispa FD-325 SS-3]